MNRPIRGARVRADAARVLRRMDEPAAARRGVHAGGAACMRGGGEADAGERPNPARSSKAWQEKHTQDLVLHRLTLASVTDSLYNARCRVSAYFGWRVPIKNNKAKRAKFLRIYLCLFLVKLTHTLRTASQKLQS